MAFKKPISDFKKFLIGVALSILPIVNFLAAGFAMECSGLGKNKPSDSMPEWGEWGDLFVKGLLAAVVGIIYGIPAGIFFLIGIAAFIIPVLSSLSGMSAMGAGAAGSQVPAEIQALLQGDFAAAIPSLLASAPFLIIAVVFGVLAAYIVPLAVLNYVKSGKFGDALKFSDILKKASTGKYFVSWLAVMGVSIVVGVVLNFIPLVGGWIASFYTVVFSYTIFGQVYTELEGPAKA